jgi:hypothetical protein
MPDVLYETDSFCSVVYSNSPHLFQHEIYFDKTTYKKGNTCLCKMCIFGKCENSLDDKINVLNAPELLNGA